MRANYLWAVCGLLLLVTACSDSNTADTPSAQPEVGAANNVRQGVLIDSVVSGARYDAGGGIIGITDVDGLFDFREGEAVSFYIGKLLLGTSTPISRPDYLTNIEANFIVTPVQLAGERALLSDQATLNIARLLLSVDEDGNPDNGIVVSPAVAERSTDLGDVVFTEEKSVVDAIRHLKNDIGDVELVVTPADAREHLCETIQDQLCDGQSSESISTTTTDTPTTDTPTTDTTAIGETSEGTISEGVSTGGATTTDTTITGETSEGGSTAVGTNNTDETDTPIQSLNSAPTIAGTPITSVEVGLSYQFEPTATDIDGDNLVYGITGKPTWATFSAITGALNGKPSIRDAGSSSTVSISVSDGTTTVSLQAYTLSVIVGNTAPTLTGEPDSTIGSGIVYEFLPAANDADDDELTFSIQGKPAWALFDTTSGALSGFPEKADVGIYENILITVTDTIQESEIGPFSITVTYTNATPQINGTPLLSTAGGEDYAFYPIASDADLDELTYAVEGLPAWATFDTTTGALTGTPTNTNTGVYPGIVISVTDGKETIELAPFTIEVTYTNTPPIISGTPKTSTLLDAEYSFTPVVTDEDPNTTFTFSAVNLPAWAVVNTATGEITGTPTEEALHESIVLSVSDGQENTELAFFIRVQALQDLAASFGVASQGSQYQSLSADLAIDGQLDTYNHTDCVAGTDWWQVALPAEMEISRIEILGRSSSSYRLEGATVFVSNTSFDNLSASEPVRGTLAGTGDKQVLEFDPPLKGSHVAVNNDAAQCLHMREVQVFGQAPDAPVTPTDQQLWLPIPASIGDLVGTVNSTDLQGDALEFELVDKELPFSIDNTGRITISQPFDHNSEQQIEFTVRVSDTVNSSTTNVTLGLLDHLGVLAERWNNITGRNVSDLIGSPNYLLPPDDTEVFAELNLNENKISYFGTRFSTLLRPDVSGMYRFAITGEDGTALDISDSIDPALAVRVVTLNFNTSHQNWQDIHASDPVRLEAGNAYFFRAWLKGSTGPEHVSVAWRRDGETDYQLVPAENLFLSVVTEDSVRPKFKPHTSMQLLGQASAIGDTVVSVAALDEQNDTLTYSIEEAVPFAIDQNGQVTVAGALAAGTIYEFNVTVTDGTHSVITPLTVNTTAASALDTALASGDSSNVTEAELVDALQTTAEADSEIRNAALSRINALDANGNVTANSITGIDWDVHRNSQDLNSSSFGGNFALLRSNRSLRYEGSDNLNLVMGGQSGDGARFAAFGSNAFHDLTRTNEFGGNANPAMQSWLENMMKWLTNSDNPGATGKTIVIAHQPDNYYTRHDATTHGWFNNAYPEVSINEPDACENALLAGCLVDADLLVIGGDFGGDDNHSIPLDINAVISAIDTAQQQNIPVVYMAYGYTNTSLGDAILAYFGLTSSTNYWSHEVITQGVPEEPISELDHKQKRLNDLVTDLDQQRLAINFSDELCPPSTYFPVNCKADQILDASGKTLQDGVLNTLKELRNTLYGTLDGNGESVFDKNTTYRTLKLAVLLGDKYREQVEFPLDKYLSDNSRFYKSMFADHTIHFARTTNPLQPDMGQHAGAQYELNAAATKTESRTVVPTLHDEWSSTGLYAPPGKPVTITRTDAGANKAKFKFNFLRTTTRPYNPNGYNRPLYITTPTVQVNSGESITVSSPYGGPIYIWSEANTANALPVTLAFENVLDNPLLDKFDTASIEAFSSALDTTYSDWIDIKTDLVEIHTKKSFMVGELNRQNGNSEDGYTTEDISDYISDLDTYLIGGNYGLAGYRGPGLPQPTAEVMQFCVDQGLSAASYESETVDLCADLRIHVPLAKQHINGGNEALCGTGCSGNPLDRRGGITPLHRIENHEMGHNLQRDDRLNIYGFLSNEISTDIFPNFVNWKHARDNGQVEASAGNGKSILSASYLKMQLEIALGTPPSQFHPVRGGKAFYIQLVYAQGSWDFYTKLYLVERIYTHALENDTRWNDVKDLLGFSNYTRAQANDITAEDFMYITASNFANRDYANWFAAFGIATSTDAQVQVAANGIMVEQPMVVYYTGDNLPVAMPSETRPLDGITQW